MLKVITSKENNWIVEEQGRDFLLYTLCTIWIFFTKWMYYLFLLEKIKLNEKNHITI